MSDAATNDEEKEEVLFKLKKTRKAFLPEYICGFFLFSLLGLAKFKEVALSPKVQAVVLSVALFCLLSAEVARAFVRYRVTPTKVVVVKGFIKQSKKNVYFHSLAFVPDISTSQSRMQRLLGYGRIYVHGGGMAEVFEINDINSPHKILQELEALIRRTRRPIG